MKTLEEIKAVLDQHRQVLREQYGLQELAIFGSYARGEQSLRSDVDILVWVRRPIGLKFFELWDYLEEILGLQVDLLTPEALQRKPTSWKNIQEELVHV